MRIVLFDRSGDHAEIDLATAVEWIQDGRLTSESLVYDFAERRWRQANALAGLRHAFTEATKREPRAPSKAVAPSPFAMADVLVKIVVGAMAAVVPIALIGGLVLLLTAMADANLEDVKLDELPLALTAALLLAITPYLSSLLLNQLNSRASARAYEQAFQKQGDAKPVITAIAAFALRKRRDRLVCTVLLFSAVLLYLYIGGDDIVSRRLIAIVALAYALLLAAYTYVLDWRIAHGLYATNEAEARELIEFVLNRASDHEISGGLGARVITQEAHSLLIHPDMEPELTR